MPRRESREVHLAHRPETLPAESDFTITTRAIDPPGAGEVLVRNVWMSVDPYMRGRMRPGRSYVEPFEVGAVLDGGSVGRIIESDHPEWAVGDWVLANRGWRELFISDGRDLDRIDTDLASPSSYLGAMGMPGLTAWVGLHRVAALAGGEVVLVTAAAGAVGSLVCQIARIHGCRVVGTAGSTEKIEWLRSIGVDEAIDYHPERRLAVALRRACSGGFDVCFDNVGGAHLEAALANMREGGRIVICGMISQYNEAAVTPGPRNLIQLIIKRLTMRGFIVNDHDDAQATFRARMAAWLRQGEVQARETVVTGIDAAPSAFIGLFTGANTGKMLVRLADESAREDAP